MSKFGKSLPVESALNISNVPFFVHIDFKGAPLKASYLKSLWPFLKKWGVQGVLLEWEDCFPYKNNLSDLSNKFYSEDDVIQILSDIKNNDLQAIPLLQTFGHLEFLLKHCKFKSLREEPLYPSSMCPSHPDALSVIGEMMNQVMALHLAPRHLHIGSDEVWHLGLCERCKSRLSTGETKEDLFLTHVKTVLELVNKEWPETRCLMWDDMLRGIDESVLRDSNLSSLVDIIVWHYNPPETFSLPPDIWQKYANIFPGIWVAGVFKGASAGSQLMPPVHRYANNALEWTKIIRKFKLKCRGFIATGWSRFDHFACLCETFPTSFVSLATVLRAFREESFSLVIIKETEEELKLTDVDLLKKSKNADDQFLLASWRVLQSTLRVLELRKIALDILLSDQLQTWMNEWQLENDEVNPMQIVPMLPAIQSTSEEFDRIERSLREAMEEVFFQKTIDEWIGTYVSGIREKINSLLKSAQKIIQKAKEDTKVVAMEL